MTDPRDRYPAPLPDLMREQEQRRPASTHPTLHEPDADPRDRYPAPLPDLMRAQEAEWDLDADSETVGTSGDDT